MAAETTFDWAEVVNYAKRTSVSPPRTQYELLGITAEDHLGVPVAVVPLWHAVADRTRPDKSHWTRRLDLAAYVQRLR